LARAARKGETIDGALEERADLLVALVLGLNIAAHGGASEADLARLLKAVRVQVHSWHIAPA
jgi:hypothetical protein